MSQLVKFDFSKQMCKVMKILCIKEALVVYFFLWIAWWISSKYHWLQLYVDELDLESNGSCQKVN